MKLSENWLREWVNPTVTADELCHRLNMAGIEASAEPLAAAKMQGVVVAKILATEQHPQADRLRVCDVDAGTGETLKIVCGAANARPGILVPAALPGSRLPNGTEIRKAALRGVESNGMLCSAEELALAEKSDGLIELDGDAKPGTPIIDYLGLADRQIELELTPNRGDCLSIAGLAREVGALYGLDVCVPPVEPASVASTVTREVIVEDAAGCPHYLGRAVTGINPDARTPDWMRERLRRSSIRTIHPLVDVTNYVLIELGQPMHAFDLERLSGAVRVRRAQSGEKLPLLNEQTIELTAQDLLIADDSGPLVLAGVMGGSASGVSTATTSIFLEAACFDPVSIATSGRRHRLLSDSRYRFERGVDPSLQRHALQRATALIQQIGGGIAGPVIEVGSAPATVAEIRLRHARVTKLLGHVLPAEKIPELLGRLGITTTVIGDGEWLAHVPPYRYDLRIEADLVEEIGRLFGYENIPPRAYAAELAPAVPLETLRPINEFKDALVARGYQEIVTYSFVDPKLQGLLNPDVAPVMLDNPIAETMAAMRTSLWSGLVATWRYNRQRQQLRARLFEAGACFALDDDANSEVIRLAGLAAGQATAEQWGVPKRGVDFYDIKADLESLFGGDLAAWSFSADIHPALHPGRSARILRDGRRAGWIGALHPQLATELDITDPLILFEIDADALRQRTIPRPETVSELPSSRRDLSLEISDEVSAQKLLASIRTAGSALLKTATVFDVYRGPSLATGSKSISLGLIFQDASRTLTIDEVDAAVAEIVLHVSTQLGASVRGS